MTPERLLSAALPAGPGKILLFKQCVTCHRQGVLHRRLEERRGWSRRNWEDSVYAMIEEWGADIPRAQIRPIAAYLAEHFGPGTRKPDTSLETLAEFLPENGSRELVLERCNACHHPEVTRRRLEERRGLPGPAWTALLERMRDYGAPLSAAELGELSAYLERTLGGGAGAEQSAVRGLYAFLPGGGERDLIAAACLACHGPAELHGLILKRPPDPYYWERVVNRMGREWEAPLHEEQNQALIEYLDRNYPPGAGGK